MSKGSKRRKEDIEKINDNWDDINWDKPKKKEVKKPPTPVKKPEKIPESKNKKDIKSQN